MTKNSAFLFIYFVFYTVSIAPLYFLNVAVNDEWWFLDEAVKLSGILQDKGVPAFILSQENLLGYGALYWIVYAVLTAYTPSPLMFMKALAFISMLLVPICIAWHGKSRRSPFLWVSLLLWLTFPMAWWTGKLTGPDLYALALAVTGMTLLWTSGSKIRWLAGAFLLGLAAGIKVTALPIICFAFLAGFPRFDVKMRLFFGVFLVFGFIACNPFVVAHSAEFAGNIGTGTPLDVFSARRIAFRLWNDFWEWDAVFSGGFFNWGLHPVAFVLFALFLELIRVRARVLFAFLLSFTVFMVMIIASIHYRGWYWFFLVALIPFLVHEGKSAGKSAAVLGALIIVVNFGFACPLIYREVKAKWDHAVMVKNKSQIHGFIANTLKTFHGRVDFAVQYVERELDYDFESKRVAVVEEADGGHAWLMGRLVIGALPPPGMTGIVVVSKRMTEFQSFHDIHRHFKKFEAFVDYKILEGEFVDLVLYRRAGRDPF